MRSARPAVLAILPILTGLALSLGAVGCASPRPAPDYPSPEDPELADTEFAALFGVERDDEEPEVDDDWVDPGPGDESMDHADAPATGAGIEAAE